MSIDVTVNKYLVEREHGEMKSKELDDLKKDGWKVTSSGVGTFDVGKTTWMCVLQKDGKKKVVRGKFN